MKKSKTVVFIILFVILLVSVFVWYSAGPAKKEPQRLKDVAADKKHEPSRISEGPAKPRKDSLADIPRPVKEQDMKTPTLPPDIPLLQADKQEPKDITPKIDSYEAPKKLAFKQPAPAKGVKQSRPRSDSAPPPQKGANLDLGKGEAPGDLAQAQNLDPSQATSISTDEEGGGQRQELGSSWLLLSRKKILTSLIVIVMLVVLFVVLRK